MSFQVQSNWGEAVSYQKQAAAAELIKVISEQHKELFDGRALHGKEFDYAMEKVRASVMANEELPVWDREEVLRKVSGYMTGYGPLKDLFIGQFKLPDGRSVNAMEITEVMVNPAYNGPPNVFVGYRGEGVFAGNHFYESSKELQDHVSKIVEDVGKFFTADNPIVHAWMADGSRVNAFGYDACRLGFGMTIRKSPLVRPPMSLDTLGKNGMFPVWFEDFLINGIVLGSQNHGFFGRTDSGKSTVLRSSGLHYRANERVIIGEVSFELALPHLPNCINFLEVGHKDRMIVTMSDICNTMNRSNPDRALVGEILGGEIVAASEIAESTSGGFATTGHAGDEYDLASRFPKMFARGGMLLPREHVNIQIGTMFAFLAFFDKDHLGKRTLMRLVEVVPKAGDAEYRLIIRFDTEEYARTNGATRRWVYESAPTTDRLSRMAFRGGIIKPEFEQVPESVSSRYLYSRQDEERGGS